MRASRVLATLDGQHTYNLDSVNPGPKATTIFEGGSDEAARLFPQQRVLSRPNRLEFKGPKRGALAPPSAQRRTARSGLSRDQPAGAGADAAGRRRCHYPVAGDHRMAGRNSPRAAAAAERFPAARPRPRLCDGVGLRYPPGPEPQGAGAAAAVRIGGTTGDGLGGMGQPRGPRGLRNIDRG